MIQAKIGCFISFSIGPFCRELHRLPLSVPITASLRSTRPRFPLTWPPGDRVVVTSHRLSSSIELSKFFIYRYRHITIKSQVKGTLFRNSRSAKVLKDTWTKSNWDSVMVKTFNRSCGSHCNKTLLLIKMGFFDPSNIFEAFK